MADERKPGTYILFLSLPQQKKIEIGKLGKIEFPAGIYAYIGSALSGWESRVNRHVVGGAKLHWHIDYLRAEAQVKGTMVFESPERLECDINRMLAKISEDVAPGFGSSDCRCETHLHLLSRIQLHDPVDCAASSSILEASRR